MKKNPKYVKYGLRVLLIAFLSVMIVTGLIITYLFIADMFYEEQSNQSIIRNNSEQGIAVNDFLI
ncbi:hypothetical protein MUO14_11875 [Halobacillus shinanisalinarum]|uniref:Two-component sensor histidine kinase n=1 Tax=Halobacillus shinanisalinarum TaxID=2932258 RepID=A0ABY4H5G3_9BACI|nr:hypothetical protein [Halobacillus shinanisalinarum]UOQ95551.1 hypothetical protein MUO14_11875 [Halobacillus shinanisalinarum]